MAERFHLDEAARQSGKSEITLRRLIKAGKIPFGKETTLTGFVYLVDPEDVKAYYAGAKKNLAEEVKVDQPETVVEEISAKPEDTVVQKQAAEPTPTETVETIKPTPEKPIDQPEEKVVQPETKPEEAQDGKDDSIEVKTAGTTRVAVGGEVGGMGEYWRKRAAVYEQRLEQEMSDHEKTRQELETIQKAKGYKPVKVMAGPETLSMDKKQPKEAKEINGDQVPAGTLIIWVLGIVVFLVALGGIAYWFFVNLQ